MTQRHRHHAILGGVVAGEDPGNMIVTTITNTLGPVGGDLAQVLLMTSLFAAALSFHNVLARYYFALGNAGALPAACGRSHPSHRSPHVASLTSATYRALCRSTAENVARVLRGEAPEPRSVFQSA